jgi:hypothetical protein
MTEQSSLSSILINPHFVQLAAFLHVPYTDFLWSSRHPKIPAQTLIAQMSKIAFKDGPLTRQNQSDFLSLFADYASQVVMEDTRLTYSSEDARWLVEVLESEQAKVTLALLFAVAASREIYLTPAEVAAALGENEVVWRRRAEKKEVPGTIRKSRGWLMPLSGLRAIGLLRDYQPTEAQHERDEGDE